MASADLNRPAAAQGAADSATLLAAVLGCDRGAAILVTDAHGAIQVFGAGAERLFGATAPEVVGRLTLLHFLAPAELDPMRAALAQSFKREPTDTEVFTRIREEAYVAGPSARPVWKCRTAKGGNVLVELVATPLPASDGASVWFLKDQRLVESMEDELRRARREAEAAAHAKALFLGNVSHEIRTPMNGVIGMADLLRTTQLNDLQRDLADGIRTSGDTLLATLNDILDLSQAEAGLLELKPGDLSPVRVVESVLELLGDSADTKELELVAHLGPGVPGKVRGDFGRVRQVLAKLIENGIKFTQQGGVSLRVVKESETDAEVVLRFTILDTGIGVPKEARDKLFLPFSQADDTSSRRYDGAGLGLAICRRIVEQMGGAIGYESCPGLGSQFWFTIRAAKAEAEAEAGAEIVDTEAARAQDILKTARVLSVSDKPLHTQFLRDQLRDWGVCMEVARDATEATAMVMQAAANDDPFKVVLLDSSSLGHNALSWLRRHRSQRSAPQAKVVVLHSPGESPETAIVRELGIDCAMAKPVRVTRLRTALVSLCSGQTLRSEFVPLERRGAEVRAARKQARILLAEDNPISQRVALQQLALMGCHAQAVANGLELLHLLKRMPCDLVFMDVDMPEMDGFEAARRVREWESRLAATGDPRPQVVIIAVTAHAIPGDRERCLAAGMNDYLSKPVEMEDLDRILTHWIRPVTTTVASLPQDPPQLPANADAARGGALPVPPMAASIDRRRLLEIAGGDGAQMVALLTLYINEVRHQLDALSAAIQAKNRAVIRQLAHRGAGGSAGCGLLLMERIFRELERLPEEVDAARAEALVAQAREELAKIEVTFRLATPSHAG